MMQCPSRNPLTQQQCTLQVSATHDGKVQSQHEVWKPNGNAPAKLTERWSA